VSRLDAIAKQKLACRRPVAPAQPGRDGRPREVLPIDRRNAVVIDIAAAPLEWLAAKGKLETNRDEPGHGLMRFTVAQHIRRIVEGAQISGLKSVGLERVSVSTAGRPLPDYKLDCMTAVGRLRRALPDRLFGLLVAIVADDRWLWQGKRRNVQRRIILTLHMAIDAAAVELGYISAEKYTRRW
jgi:hypothetical protein